MPLKHPPSNEKEQEFLNRLSRCFVKKSEIKKDLIEAVTRFFLRTVAENESLCYPFFRLLLESLSDEPVQNRVALLYVLWDLLIGLTKQSKKFPKPLAVSMVNEMLLRDSSSGSYTTIFSLFRSCSEKKKTSVAKQIDRLHRYKFITTDEELTECKQAIQQQPRPQTPPISHEMETLATNYIEVTTNPNVPYHQAQGILKQIQTKAIQAGLIDRKEVEKYEIHNDQVLQKALQTQRSLPPPPPMNANGAPIPNFSQPPPHHPPSLPPGVLPLPPPHLIVPPPHMVVPPHVAAAHFMPPRGPPMVQQQHGNPGQAMLPTPRNGGGAPPQRFMTGVPPSMNNNNNNNNGNRPVNGRQPMPRGGPVPNNNGFLKPSDMIPPGKQIEGGGREPDRKRRRRFDNEQQLSAQQQKQTSMKTNNNNGNNDDNASASNEEEDEAMRKWKEHQAKLNARRLNRVGDNTGSNGNGASGRTGHSRGPPPRNDNARHLNNSRQQSSQYQPPNNNNTKYQQQKGNRNHINNQRQNNGGGFEGKGTSTNTGPSSGGFTATAPVQTTGGLNSQFYDDESDDDDDI